MTHDPLCLCSEGDDECKYCYREDCFCDCTAIRRVRPLILRDAVEAVKAYADERLVVTEHPNMSEDITAALHIAAKRIEGLEGER